jgi:hypothetical protein
LPRLRYRYPGNNPGTITLPSGTDSSLILLKGSRGITRLQWRSSLMVTKAFLSGPFSSTSRFIYRSGQSFDRRLSLVRGPRSRCIQVLLFPCICRCARSDVRNLSSAVKSSQSTGSHKMAAKKGDRPKATPAIPRPSSRLVHNKPLASLDTIGDVHLKPPITFYKQC